MVDLPQPDGPTSATFWPGRIRQLRRWMTGRSGAVGYAKLWLDSSRRFTSAHRLYERNGFVLVERLDNDWEDNVYEKSLEEPKAP